MGGQKLLCEFYLDKASHSGMNVPHEHCGPSHSGCGKHKSNGNGRPLEVFHYLESPDETKIDYSFWRGNVQYLLGHRYHVTKLLRI